MKNFLLSFIFIFLTIGLFAQIAGYDSGNSGLIAANFNTNQTVTETNLQIFPNPAVNYIGVSENSSVERIVVYNLVGRQMKTFPAADGEQYYIGDLRKGMYLVQLLGANSKVIKTQRISKR